MSPARAPAPTAQEHPVDRQQRLREHVDQVEALVVRAAAGLEDAQQALDATEAALAEQQQRLQQAERHHRDALTSRSAAVAEHDAAQGELAASRRRLELGQLVRRTRG